MIPGPKELQEIARLKEGNLREVPFAPLLQALSVHERSVVLEIRRNQLEKKIIIEEGVPIDCRSNLLHETLGKFLVHRGKLSEEDYQRCLAESVQSSQQFGEVLLKFELVSVFDFFRLLQQNMAHRMLDGFTWKEGNFRILAEQPGVESPLKVKVPQLILTGISRYTPQDVVDAEVGTLVGVALTVHPSPVVPVGALKLNAKQSRVMTLLKGRLRIDELGADARLPPDELARLLYALAVLGVVVPADQVPVAAVSAPAPSAAPPPPPPVVTVTPAPQPQPVAVVEAAPTVGADQIERIKNDVTRAYLSYRKQDAFELLGLPLDAQPSLIREKYLAYSQKYAPWSFDHPGLAPLVERAQDLFLAGARAYATLMDAEQRNSLIFRRQNAQQAPKGNPTAYFAIRTDLLDSETQYKQGVARMNAGRFAEAAGFYEFASDCDPQNSLYRADLAWCRFKANPDAAQQSLKDLGEALRMDPDCGVASYYAGEICRKLGDRTNAEAHLRRACKILQGDRRPTDALKSLLTEPVRSR